ncbi:MAG: hypothetical protein CMB48_06900 [Euryarchaeota archaeon]|nr:hypothetical protein [Euryarchaeota archaeon]|tara:strand:+ start:1959 stop:2375 length:417 start_codon:yes stop_codon:yes gene_type:complete
MNKSLYRFTGFILLPFLTLYISWLFIGENYDGFSIQIINSFFTNILLVIGFTTLCSWWFCFTRSSSIITPLVLTTIFTILFVVTYYLFNIENLQPQGLKTPVAIILNSTLESLTILLSFAFVLLIGILISKESNLEEE